MDWISELCQASRKRLYVLGELKSMKAPNENKCFFVCQAGIGIEILRYNDKFVSQYPRFGWTDERIMINVPAFCLRRIGHSCHTRSTFAKEVFPSNIVFPNMWRFQTCSEDDFGCFLKSVIEFARSLDWNLDEQLWEGWIEILAEAEWFISKQIN